MNAETGGVIGVAVFLYLSGMLQTVNAVRFYSNNASYFDGDFVGPLLGMVFWPFVAVALWFMYRHECASERKRKGRA